MIRRTKIRIKPLFILLLVLIPVLAVCLLVTNTLKEKEVEPSYVTEETFDDALPVVNTTPIVINPYVGEGISIGKDYYDYKSEEEAQKKSIVVHDNTYIQNTGIDYVSENTFDVVSILDGTVVSVKEDETLGKTIEIKHGNDLISSYQGLSEITVKKGDIVNQGQVIGRSGTNELDKELGNHLHFEMYNNGQTVKPSNYLNKEIPSKKN